MIDLGVELGLGCMCSCKSNSSLLYNHLKNRNYSQATDGFADIVRGGAGLKQRQQDEINIFKNNIYNDHN